MTSRALTIVDPATAARRSAAAHIGDRFGRLVILAAADPYKRPTGNRSDRRWTVRCDCGSERIVHERSLKAGTTQSCGCLQIDISRAAHTKHGEAARRTVEYVTWKNIILRCCNPDDQHYADYGGRGIMICERWRNSYEAFLADLGRRPSPKHSIDRIDNDGHYEPSNCRWATEYDQRQNRRNTLKVAIDGQLIPLTVACSIRGVDYNKVRGRIRRGMAAEAALIAAAGAK